MGLRLGGGRGGVGLGVVTGEVLVTQARGGAGWWDAATGVPTLCPLLGRPHRDVNRSTTDTGPRPPRVSNRSPTTPFRPTPSPRLVGPGLAQRVGVRAHVGVVLPVWVGKGSQKGTGKDGENPGLRRQLAVDVGSPGSYRGLVRLLDPDAGTYRARTLVGSSSVTRDPEDLSDGG